MNLDWSEPITWITIVLLLALLAVQGWFISQQKTLSAGRKLTRLGLNLVLWLVLVAFVVQPRWTVTVESKQALVAANEVPNAYINHLKDSLSIQQSFRADNFKGQFETVTLVGQQVPTGLLSQLSQSFVEWIPYVEVDQLQAIHWKGVVRNGELQQVTGKIQASAPKLVRVRYGAQTLDSVKIAEGTTTFRLQFPAFTNGQTETVLTLDSQPLDTIRYFTRPVRPLTYQFVLNSPDFESKTLADWLGQHGHTVLVTSTIAKNLNNSIAINKKLTGASPDIIITDPDNATDPLVKKAVSQGKPVLFINLTNPEVDTRTINQALGSNWRMRRISNDDHVPASNGLTALPFTFLDALNQRLIPSYPIGIQRTPASVAVSLLTETFPLKLSGDSIAYSKLWTAILAPLQPADKNAVSVDAPVVSGLRGTIHLNNWASKPAIINLNGDTTAVGYSAINPLSGQAAYLFSKPGWYTLQDSLQVYVDGLNSLTNSRRVQTYALAHAAYQTAGATVAGEHWKEIQVPTWAWLVVFLVCFTALWVEPKLG